MWATGPASRWSAAAGPSSRTARTCEVVDLPGTYSLAARSEDERVASRFLAAPEVDLVLNVLDASNLERNLYLTTQLLELGKPVVFVLNMMDDAENRGVHIDVAALETLLGGPVIPTVGNREQGIPELKSLAGGHGPRRIQPLPPHHRGLRPRHRGRAGQARNGDLPGRAARGLHAPPLAGPPAAGEQRRGQAPGGARATPARPSGSSWRRASPSWNPTWAPTARPSWPSAATASPTAW